MSTRCQVIVKDEYNELWFYRHHDGYPEGATPTLIDFMRLVKSGKIRRNVEQACGWLVLIGAKEYNVSLDAPDRDDHYNWKAGAYESSVPKQHGDIDFLYTLDLKALTITYRHVNSSTTTSAVHTVEWENESVTSE